MTLIVGPLFNGKRRFAMELLGCGEEELARRAVWDVQDLAGSCSDLEALAAVLSAHEVVIATEVGGGVLMGVSKPVIKAHGSSDALAIRGAIKQAMNAVESNFCADIKENVSQMVLPREALNAEKA